MNMFDYHKSLVERRSSIRKRNVFGTTKLKNEKEIKFPSSICWHQKVFSNKRRNSGISKKCTNS